MQGQGRVGGQGVCRWVGREGGKVREYQMKKQNINRFSLWEATAFSDLVSASYHRGGWGGVGWGVNYTGPLCRVNDRHRCSSRLLQRFVFPHPCKRLYLVLGSFAFKHNVAGSVLVHCIIILKDFLCLPLSACINLRAMYSGHPGDLIRKVKYLKQA